MKTEAKISLSVPNPEKPGSYFSFRLKQRLNNEPAVYRKAKRLLALSDIEGNFLALRKLLIRNGVIDGRYEWTFEDGHLVIIGDCFDRGEQVVECLWLIYSLEEKARREGGYVHFILGNHEIMNLNGDWRYIHPKYAEKRSTSKTPAAALYAGNNELWNWLCTKNIMEKIGDILFVHGGISSVINQCRLSVTEINDLARPFYKSAGQQFSDPLLHVIFNTQESPFWYRGYYQGSASDEQIDDTLKKFGVTSIITGHSIVNQVGCYFNGKVINVNTDHAGGTSEVLLIKKERFYKVDISGKRIGLNSVY